MKLNISVSAKLISSACAANYIKIFGSKEQKMDKAEFFFGGGDKKNPW
jgi:hypothetical protein